MSHGLSDATNALLTQLVMELKSGHIKRCVSLGLTTREMQMLNAVTLEDLHYLLNSSVSVFTYKIHHENLALMFEHARRERRVLDRIDRALLLGGSIEMMQHYFGMSTMEVAARRRLTGILTSKGRYAALTDEDNGTLWLRWKKEKVNDTSCAEGLDVMMQAAEEMQVSLTAVWHAVCDFDDLINENCLNE
ncbi:DUF2857 domain-containing protein [Serratia sp. M24T3]|uniref:DUF2857 domain-containing protein n=1 Tax=Serratia sp. M24T3 TaxID=932213 RepID=UPI00025BBA8A|nr:DUF2857 domain-containing protein [Serratia sp. M24T3]EIC83397.1 hypothetical protein SPM24T3_17340 [Serratia sp. M24T3]